MIARDEPFEAERAIPTFARIALIGVAVLAILAWLFLAFTHLHDRYNVNAVSGTLLALADRARDGVLYPPFFDGQSFGGTRAMPLPILLYGFAMSTGGDLLASAKFVDFLASALLVLLLIGILRRQRAGWILSLALASTVVTSQVFLLTGAGIRPEALPTLLQLGAVALVAFVPRRAAVLLAAMLCAVALFTKLSALWAPLAIAAWLLSRDRLRLAMFSAAMIAATFVLIVIFTVASDGRMLANLLGLGGAGISMVGIVKAPLKAVELLLQYAQASFLLLPVLLLGLYFATRDARPTIFALGLLAAVAILLTVMADVGSDYNHLLDIVVLLPIVSFEVVRNLASRLDDPRAAWAFLVTAVVVGSGAAVAVNAGSSIAAAVGLPGASQTASNDPQPLVAELAGSATVLAEDPYINLSRGDRPVVIDPFMFLRIAQRDPNLVEPLLSGVASGRFDAIVLTRDLGEPASAAWYRDFAFGQSFYEAARDKYRLCSVSGDFFLYFANSRPCPDL